MLWKIFSSFLQKYPKKQTKKGLKALIQGCKEPALFGVTNFFFLGFWKLEICLMSLAQGWKIFFLSSFRNPKRSQGDQVLLQPLHDLLNKKRNYPVKQQAHAKSLAVWLSTFFILVWPVWLQFGHCTVVGYLVRYMPFVVAPGKNPSKKRQIESKIVLTYCEKKMYKLVIEKNFWNSRLKAEKLQNFWDH